MLNRRANRCAHLALNTPATGLARSWLAPVRWGGLQLSRCQPKPSRARICARHTTCTTRTAPSHAGGPPRKRARDAHGAIAATEGEGEGASVVEAVSSSANRASDTDDPDVRAAGGS